MAEFKSTTLKADQSPVAGLVAYMIVEAMLEGRTVEKRRRTIARLTAIADRLKWEGLARDNVLSIRGGHPTLQRAHITATKEAADTLDKVVRLFAGDLLDAEVQRRRR